MEQHIIHAHMGISSESGEIGDCIKKYYIYNQPLDYINLLEECGDLLWYVSLMVSACGSNLEHVMEQNIEKLKIRYPEKFTEHHAKERLDKKTSKFVVNDAVTIHGHYHAGAKEGTITELCNNGGYEVTVMDIAAQERATIFCSEEQLTKKEQV
jgi:NTP pyrophosphatase (non-canonical NTP hydrolase)